MAVIHSEIRGSGTTAVLAWPSEGLTYQPGVRLGIGNARHRDEVLFDTGLLVIDEGGSTFSQFIANIAYQRAFRASQATSPIATLGIGIQREGGASESSISPMVGAGLGLRHVIHEDHGAVRAEFRVDYLASDDTFSRPALTSIGVRLGFDVWF